MMNIATTLCKRLNVKELVTNVPVYGSISGNLHFYTTYSFDLSSM